MDDIKVLFSSLPHHSLCGMFENPRTAPVWEAQYGLGFTTEFLLKVAEDLLAANARNHGVEWGDTRARCINASWANFLQFAAAARTR